jgi:replication-associated recombination protein RarA
MECLPPELNSAVFYNPTERGAEKRIRDRIEELRKLRESTRVE